MIRKMSDSDFGEMVKAQSEKESNWISVEDKKPEEGDHVLMLIVYQRFCGGTHCEDSIIVTGGRKDDDWFVGNDMMFWDFEYNLGFTDDDVTHWMPFPPLP